MSQGMGLLPYIIMSILEAPCLIEAAPNGFSSCHKIVQPPQNRCAGASNKKLTESIHKYIVQVRHMLRKITMAATTSCFLCDSISHKTSHCNILYRLENARKVFRVFQTICNLACASVAQPPRHMINSQANEQLILSLVVSIPCDILR